MAGHYVTLLGSLVADPVVPISRARLLTDAEEQYLLRDVGVGQEGLGGARDDFDREVPVHVLFERFARENPSALAVAYEAAGMSCRSPGSCGGAVVREWFKKVANVEASQMASCLSHCCTPLLACRR